MFDEMERSGQEAESVNKLKSMLRELERCEAEIADCFAIERNQSERQPPHLASELDSEFGRELGRSERNTRYFFSSFRSTRILWI